MQPSIAEELHDLSFLYKLPQLPQHLVTQPLLSQQDSSECKGQKRPREAETHPAPPRKKQKTRRNKNRDAPRKADNVWILFNRLRWREIKDANPHLGKASLEERNKILKAEWDKMTEQQKKPYYDMFHQEQEKLRQELVKREETHPILDLSFPKRVKLPVLPKGYEWMITRDGTQAVPVPMETSFPAAETSACVNTGVNTIVKTSETKSKPSKGWTEQDEQDKRVLFAILTEKGVLPFVGKSKRQLEQACKLAKISARAWKEARQAFHFKTEKIKDSVHRIVLLNSCPETSSNNSSSPVQSV